MMELNWKPLKFKFFFPIFLLILVKDKATSQYLHEGPNEVLYNMQLLHHINMKMKILLRGKVASQLQEIEKFPL
jgi:hypothetical protein